MRKLGRGPGDCEFAKSSRRCKIAIPSPSSNFEATRLLRPACFSPEQKTRANCDASPPIFPILLQNLRTARTPGTTRVRTHCGPAESSRALASSSRVERPPKLPRDYDDLFKRNHLLSKPVAHFLPDPRFLKEGENGNRGAEERELGPADAMKVSDTSFKVGLLCLSLSPLA